MSDPDAAAGAGAVPRARCELVVVARRPSVAGVAMALIQLSARATGSATPGARNVPRPGDGLPCDPGEGRANPHVGRVDAVDAPAAGRRDPSRSSTSCGSSRPRMGREILPWQLSARPRRTHGGAAGAAPASASKLSGGRHAQAWAAPACPALRAALTGLVGDAPRGPREGTVAGDGRAGCWPASPPVGCVLSWLSARSTVAVAPVIDGEPMTTSVIYSPPLLVLSLILATVAGVLAVLGVARLRRA